MMLPADPYEIDFSATNDKGEKIWQENNMTIDICECGHAKTKHNYGDNARLDSYCGMSCGCRNFKFADPHLDCEDHPCPECAGQAIDDEMQRAEGEAERQRIVDAF